LHQEFWKEVKVPGTSNELNQELEKAIRVADFFGIARLMVLDALNRNESCGAHFREESQTETGETKRDDANYAYVSAWEFKGENQEPILHKEPLVFENVELKIRDYK
jgi:succinate dehydrogenase / fumarate reductase flavoprotein subunit